MGNHLLDTSLLDPSLLDPSLLDPGDLFGTRISRRPLRSDISDRLSEMYDQLLKEMNVSIACRELGVPHLYSYPISEEPQTTEG